MKRSLIIEDFEGGQSTDLKVGIKNSQAYTQSLDFRKSPSQFSVLPAPAREDNNIVKDLIVNEVMDNTGAIWAFGNQGYFYKRTTGGTWSVVDKLATGYFGEDYRKDTDSIYLCSSKAVSVYNPLTTTPSMTPNKYGPSYSQFVPDSSLPFNASPFQEGSTFFYTPPTAISEATTNLRYFQSDIEPLVKITVFVVTKGTGDWTLTLHDGLNNVLGSSTITNANLVNNTATDFFFTTATNGQVRIYIAPNARTYHTHLTSTVADGTVTTSIANDFSESDLQVWADRLIQTNNGMHPLVRFQQYECFGNGNYLSIWEPLNSTDTTTMTSPEISAEWVQHKLFFPEEYEVCGLATTNEFLVIAAEKNTTGNPTPQEGILFFWDGVSPTYNYFVVIEEGSPYGIHTYKNIAYYYAGGAWYGIDSPTTIPVKLRTMPGTDTEFSSNSVPIIVYPYAATVRRGIQLMGWPSTSTNTSINFGVYSYGAVDKNYDESFGYSYIISTGTKNYSASNNLQIGTVQAFGDLLHISWRDDLNGMYGIDAVTNSSVPTAYSVWQSLIFDAGYVGKLKTALYMDCSFNDLPSGATITLGYQIDRSGTWVTSQAYSVTNLWEGRHNYARFAINSSSATGGRFREIQLQIEINCSNAVTQPPAVTQVGLSFDDNRDEIDG